MIRKSRIILVSVGIFILALLILPFIIPVNQFRLSIEQKTSATLGRNVTLGNLRLSVFSGSLSAENLSVGDDPKFSPSSFLAAKSLKVRIELIPLIFSKTLIVTGISIQNPQVTLIRNSAGQWNYSSLAGSSRNVQPTHTLEPPNSGFSSSPARLSIKSLKLADGRIIIGSTNSDKRSTYDHVNISASNVSLTSRFPVTVTADLPGEGKFSLAGSVGPIDQTDVSNTPANAKIKVSSLDLASTGLLDPSLRLGGLLDLDATLSSQNGEAETNGTARLSRALLISGGAPASMPVLVDFDTRYDLRKNSGVLKPSTLKIGNAVAQLSGTYEIARDAVLNIRIDGQGMPAKDLESFLPAVGVSLPRRVTVQSGTLNANLNLTGPTYRIVTTGNVGLFGAKLTGFGLESTMSAISSTIGVQTGKDLQIEKLTTNVRMVPDGLKVDHLIVVFPLVGSLVGSGSIDSRNNLDFNVTATLADGLRAAGDTGSSAATIDLSGTWQLQNENPMVNLKVAGERLPIDRLQALMNARAIKLPNGATLTGGTLDLAFVLTGLSNALTITGPVQLTNTRVVGFDLGSRIRGIAALSGIKTGDTTSIGKLQLNLRITNAGTQVDSIYARIPAMGVITGSGTVSPTSELDFALTAKVTAAQGIGKIGAGVLTKLNGSTNSGDEARATGVPMLVTGTANEPIITADIHGLLDRKKKAFLNHFEKKK